MSRATLSYRDRLERKARADRWTRMKPVIEAALALEVPVGFEYEDLGEGRITFQRPDGRQFSVTLLEDRWFADPIRVWSDDPPALDEFVVPAHCLAGRDEAVARLVGWVRCSEGLARE